MAEAEERTIALRFVVGDLLTMGFAAGRANFHDDGSWMSFSLAPDVSDYPSQTIWIRSKDPKHTTGGNEIKRERDGVISWGLSSKTPGSLYLQSTKADGKAPDDGPILTWNPEFSSQDHYIAESFSIILHVQEKDFDSIRTLVAAGKPPVKVTIRSPDVESGNAPDGSDKVWRVDTSPYARVTAYSLGMSVAPQRVLVGSEQTEIDADETAERDAAIHQAILHFREDIQLLRFGQNAINGTLSAIRWQLSALVVLSIVSAALAVLSYLR